MTEENKQEMMLSQATQTTPPEVTVYLECCREGACIPEYKNLWDAGMDVCAFEDVLLEPGETKIIPTGLKFAIPPGYEIQVRPRSGISLHTPLRISNSPGTIDTGYRGELGIIVSNSSEKAEATAEKTIWELSQKGNMKGAYQVKKGDRIAQIVLCAVPRMKFVFVGDVTKIGEDRGGGFGSTGIK